MLKECLVFKPLYFVYNFLYKALCDGGEEINTMLEKPIDPLAYGPFCSHCHVVFIYKGNSYWIFYILNKDHR